MVFLFDCGVTGTVAAEAFGDIDTPSIVEDTGGELRSFGAAVVLAGVDSTGGEVYFKVDC